MQDRSRQDRQLEARAAALDENAQQLNLMIAAVVGKPSIILADEPTGNRDSKNGMEVMQLLSDLNEEGTTIVIVTHSKHDVTYASRIIHLFEGKVVDAMNDNI